MFISLTMPQFGESITHGRIVHWLKGEGDEVKEAEPLVEMETEKAVFAYESPYRGKLVKILSQNESEAAVGSVIARFEVPEEDGARYLSLGIGRPVEVADKQPLSPLIRSLAKEHGIPMEELANVKWKGGRVTKADFLRYLEEREGKIPAPGEGTPSQGVRRPPISPIRLRIAERMLLSRQKIPHAGCGVEVDLTAVETCRSAIKERGEAVPGYLPFVAWAALKGLKEFPCLNSSWKEDGGRPWIEEYESVHLGIAVATERGLIVPVIRDADRPDWRGIVKEIERVATSGRAGEIPPQDMTGATFTVNNVGALGAIRSDQIIPPPQAAILAVNRVVRRPWVVEDRIVIRPIVNLDLAFDHRVIDGETATLFLVSVKNRLETVTLKDLEC